MRHRRQQIGTAFHFDQPRPVFGVMCVTPLSLSWPSIIFQIAGAAPGVVNAASFASGSSGGLAVTGPIFLAIAAAISLVWRLAQIVLVLMQPRPLLANTLSTMMSRYCSQLSTTSSPSRILLKPGPCT